MVPAVRVLHGLPPYGPPAIAFPGEWGRLGREGIVVEFRTEAGTWVGNFQPGLGGLQLAGLHPNKRDAVVIAAGDLWVIDPGVRTAERLLPAIDALCSFESYDLLRAHQGLSRSKTVTALVAALIQLLDADGGFR